MARNVSPVDSIEVGSDLDFEKRWRRVQRVLWTVMSLVVVAGLLGLFGRGPLSHGKAIGRSASAEFERFARFKTPAQITFLVPGGISGSSLDVFVDAPLLESLRIEQTKPQPVDMRAEPGGGATMQFLKSTSAPFTVHFTQEFSKVGPQEGELMVAGEQLQLRQFVYP
jgi:hypothetical protein